MNERLHDLGTEFREDFARQFTALYCQTFPESDMREDPQRILERVRLQARAVPRTALVVAVRAGRVVGAVTYEWYAHCRCGLMTYLLVAPDCRGEGVAERLRHATHHGLEAIDSGVRAVFAETEKAMSPDRATRARLRALDALGFRHLPIDYVQPRLSSDQARCAALMLLVSPAPGAAPPRVSRDLVATFLGEFYSAMGDELDDEDLARMLEDAPIDAPIASRALPLPAPLPAACPAQRRRPAAGPRRWPRPAEVRRAPARPRARARHGGAVDAPVP